MDKKYITLFKELTRATAVSAEVVMEYDKEKGDEKGYETAQTMRDDFQDLSDRIDDSYVLTKADTAKFLVATLIMVNQLQDQIEARQKAIAGYRTDLIPKLQAILDEAETDEEAQKLAEENFIIENNEVNT